MRVLVVVGTRPEAIKMAPVFQELARRAPRFDPILCLTAQHRDLLDSVIQTFQLPVQYDLDAMSQNQTIFDVTSRVLLGMKQVLEEAKPDVMLIHGDTTTSFASALAAYYLRIPVGHVEAGLRTYDKFRPFPEEINRRMADALCDFHYAPTPAARENLLREHIPDEGVLITGNTVIDALLDVASRPYNFSDPFLEALGKDRRLILVTAHRRESFGARFREMCEAMRDIVAHHDDVEIVYPVHPNPNVRAVVGEVLAGLDRIHPIEPLDYVPFVHLLKKSHFVLTDSGGVQEEAPSLGVPVLVMRELTERPEAVEAGTARLVGNRYEGILREAERLLTDDAAFKNMCASQNPYGDGNAAQRIADHLEQIASRE